MVEMRSLGNAGGGRSESLHLRLRHSSNIFQGCGGNKVTVIAFLWTNHLRIKWGSLEENRSMGITWTCARKKDRVWVESIMDWILISWMLTIEHTLFCFNHDETVVRHWASMMLSVWKTMNLADNSGLQFDISICVFDYIYVGTCPYLPSSSSRPSVCVWGVCVRRCVCACARLPYRYAMSGYDK